MSTTAEVSCLKCHTSAELGEYLLTEGALLVCPNCGAEFSLTATLETLPDGADDVGTDDFMPEPELPEPPVAPPASPGPAAELEPPVTASKTALKREPVIEVHVLACSECKNTWVGTHAKHCPSCHSTSVMRTNTSIAERAMEAVTEIQFGVPVNRVLAKMVGAYRPVRRGPRRRRRTRS